MISRLDIDVAEPALQGDDVGACEPGRGDGCGAIWDSLFLAHTILVKSARYVATEFGFEFPGHLATRVRDFLAHVRCLPADAECIYERRGS